MHIYTMSELQIAHILPQRDTTLALKYRKHLSVLYSRVSSKLCENIGMGWSPKNRLSARVYL